MLPFFSQAAKMIRECMRGKRLPIVNKVKREPLRVESLENRVVPSITTQTDSYTVLSSQQSTSDVSVLANDSNSYELPMASALVQGPTHATIVWHADGTFDLTPDGFKGVDQLYYAATVDTGSGTETAFGQANLLFTGVATWTGDGDGVSWSDAQNWQGDLLPGEYDDVVIDAPDVDIVIGATDVVKIRSLQCTANLEVDGTLTLTAGESQ
jgi:hypothetical protein